MPTDPGSEALQLATQVNKIGFVEFTSDLVRNVYTTIVTSSMDQLKAYADFVRVVSKSLSEYQNQALGGSDATSQTATANSYIKDVLGIADPNANPIPLTPDQVSSLSDNFSGIKRAAAPIIITDAITVDAATKAGTITPDNLRLFVIEKIKVAATDSYEILKTILKIGMQKIVVSDGYIETKLTFHVDSTDTQGRTSTDSATRSMSKNFGGGLNAGAGGILGKILGATIGGSIGGGKQSTELKVNVVNETSASALNVKIDVTGLVRIAFRTESFPTPPNM